MSMSGSGEAPRAPSPAHPSAHSPLPHLPDYAELHCLTNFTFLRGASRPDELVAQLEHRLANRTLPITLVRLTSEDPQEEHQYRELDDVLGDWMAKKGCTVLLVRPDHYVYGGARTLEEAIALFDGCLEGLGV